MISDERLERQLLEVRKQVRTLKRQVAAIGNALVEAQVCLRRLDPGFQR